MTDVLIQRLNKSVSIPAYANSGDAGVDLQCVEDFELKPGQRLLVSTGIAIALPPGYVGLIHPRSGLAVKQGISIVNSPGTIDAGYRGEIKVCLLNTDSTATAKFSSGSRIAQLVIQRVEQAKFYEVAELPQSDRGGQGFGSSGI
jgi:dUTP pyrophosphatase